MTALGDIFLGIVLGVMLVVVPLSIIHWQREDAEEFARAESWESIKEVMDDVA
jgi:hypothetical protein